MQTQQRLWKHSLLTLILSFFYFCRQARTFSNLVVSLPQKHCSRRTMKPSTNTVTLRSSKITSTLVSPVDLERRNIPVASWPVFLTTVAFLPVWAGTIVPISAAYQIGRVVVRKLLATFQTSKKTPLLTYDSGYVVDPSKIVPRSDRKYDIVVLGATGFCGRLAARHLAKTYGVDGNMVKWAIAGRSKSKLDQVKKELADELGFPNLNHVDVIVVDTSVPATLPALVEQTRVVASTTGPFVLYGNHVCEFCAKFGTHYVDITGEVDWVKSMHVLWHKTAEQTGAKLISFCGNDSIPWDLSLMKLRQRLQQECNDELVAVSFWDQLVGGAPGGTFATALANLDGAAPPPITFDPFERRLDGSASLYSLKPNLPIFLAKADSPWDGASSKRWQGPFIMALINSQVCRWSYALQSTDAVKSISYTESAIYPDLKSAVVGYASVLVLASLITNPITRPIVRWLVPQPGSGPDQTQMETKHFLCVYGLGQGVGGSQVESYMYFPLDPGCLETSRMLIESGLCLALHSDSLPRLGGGFYPPSVALGDVLMTRLLNTGTKFESRVHVTAGQSR